MSKPKALKYFRCEDHQTELRIAGKYLQVMYNREQVAVFLLTDVQKFTTPNGHYLAKLVTPGDLKDIPMYKEQEDESEKGQTSSQSSETDLPG